MEYAEGTNNYEKLRYIFSDKFLKLSQVSFEDIVADVQSVSVRSELTTGLTTLMSTLILRDLHPKGWSEVCVQNNITGKRTCLILQLVVYINDLLTKVNTILDFNSPLGHTIFAGYGGTVKRSSQTKNGYQGLTSEERIFSLMYLLCDIVACHDPRVVANFADRVIRLCGSHSVYNLLHALCHSEAIDEELKTCASDFYIFFLMITNLTKEEGIPDGYISPSVIEGACDRCKLAPWINPNVWSLVMQSGVYMRRVAEGRPSDPNIYNNFIRTNGGNLLNLLGIMYTSKCNYNLLYNVGMIYGIVAPKIFDTVDGVTQVDRLTMESNDGVLSVIKRTEHGYSVNVIEQQTDGYVYYSLDSIQPLNYDHVEYYRNLQVQVHGGYQVPGTIKFTENQMASFGELLSYAICAYLVYIIISSILASLRKDATFKSRVNVPTFDAGTKSENANLARVNGSINVNIPDVAEGFVYM